VWVQRFFVKKLDFFVIVTQVLVRGLQVPYPRPLVEMTNDVKR
jgi:hypothetical protein